MKFRGIITVKCSSLAGSLGERPACILSAVYCYHTANDKNTHPEDILG